MKKNLCIVAIVLSVLAVIAFAGCDMLASQDMMEDFIDDVNASNWSALNAYLDSEVSPSPSIATWESLFDGYQPIDLGITTDSAATATGLGGVTFTFEIEDDSGDMKIRRIYRNGAIQIE